MILLGYKRFEISILDLVRDMIRLVGLGEFPLILNNKSIKIGL
jgi:hypothetical protein